MKNSEYECVKGALKKDLDYLEGLVGHLNIEFQTEDENVEIIVTVDSVDKDVIEHISYLGNSYFDEIIIKPVGDQLRLVLK